MPAGDPEDEVVLPGAPPADGGVGQPCGCGGGGDPESPELEPPPGDAPPDWDPPGAEDPALPGEPELPEDGCWPGLPDDVGDCWPEPPPELGLEGEVLPEEDGDEGEELGMPLGIELELVVRHPLVASEAAATNTAAVSPLLRRMR